MVKTCDNNIARRNTKATLDLFEFDIEEQVMAQKTNGDRNPKALKTILPAKRPKPTRIKAGHELLPWLLLTASLTDTHESLCSGAKIKGFNRYNDTISHCGLFRIYFFKQRTH